MNAEETIRTALRVIAQHNRAGRCTEQGCTGDNECPALVSAQGLTKPGEW